MQTVFGFIWFVSGYWRWSGSSTSAAVQSLNVVGYLFDYFNFNTYILIYNKTETHTRHIILHVFVLQLLYHSMKYCVVKMFYNILHLLVI